MKTNQTGKIVSVFIKTEHGMPMLAPPDNTLTVKARYGIVNDINSNPLSPRHVLLVATESLNDFCLQPSTLRENIVTSGFDINNLKSGSVIQVGPTALIRITFSCEVCKYIVPLNIPFSKMLIGKRGMLGVILQDGQVTIHDPIVLLHQQYSEVPASLFDRFIWFVNQIPQGKIMTYKQLLTAIGCSMSYARAIPGFIKRAERKKLPLHRIVDTSGKLISYVDEQEKLLSFEGVISLNSTLDIQKYGWDFSELYYQYKL